MRLSPFLPLWTIVAPCIGWGLLGLGGFEAAAGPVYMLLLVPALLGCVLAAVHHAEVVAHQVGEPFGTLLLAMAVTVIEVALIVSLMLSGGSATAALARDTVFAAVMIIMNGMVGICLLLGAGRHHEQSFKQSGVSASLAMLAAISVLTMVLPNYTTSAPGPSYSTSQLIFIAVVALVLYGTFVLVQTVRHRDYFLPAAPESAPATTTTSTDRPSARGHGSDTAVDAVAEDDDLKAHAAPPGRTVALASAALLLACLGAVVLLAKKLAPSLAAGVSAMGAPEALVGVIIAAVVLLPEGLAAIRAARANRLQTSLNLALGSALASIGLTIPAVAIVSIATGWTLTLGLDARSTVLLMLSLVVATLSLGTGRTTVLQGVVHLVLFAVYLFTTVVP